jgi:hypothetical protein
MDKQELTLHRSVNSFCISADLELYSKQRDLLLYLRQLLLLLGINLNPKQIEIMLAIIPLVSPHLKLPVPLLPALLLDLYYEVGIAVHTPIQPRAHINRKEKEEIGGGPDCSSPFKVAVWSTLLQNRPNEAAGPYYSKGPDSIRNMPTPTLQGTL